MHGAKCVAMRQNPDVDQTTGIPYYILDKSFEWDNVKAIANWRAHGVSFEMARDVFKDVFAVEWVDDRQGSPEERFAAVGMVENRLLFVAYTMSGDSDYLSSKGRTL